MRHDIDIENGRFLFVVLLDLNGNMQFVHVAIFEQWAEFFIQQLEGPVVTPSNPTRSAILAPQTPTPFSDAAPSRPVIDVNDMRQYQSKIGRAHV